MKFQTSQGGFATGLRFYKGTSNTGTHVGSLWNRTGTLLGRATFAGESASGWQQVLFPTPVALDANTTYVASYFAPAGRYAFTSNYFGSAGTVHGPLTALRNGADGGNGVYRYASGPAFPNQSYNSSNYWVDVVVSVGSTPTPTRTSTATPTSTPTATFTPTATATPTPDLGYGCPCTVWNDAASPAIPAWNDPDAARTGVEVGVKFQAEVDGRVNGLRFYKGSGNSGTHTGSLWSRDGTLLASAEPSNETALGWQTINFPAPVAISAGTTYVVSYHAPVGQYAFERDYFTGEVRSGPLRLLRDGEDGPNGLYAYGARQFPVLGFEQGNYGVDLVFATDALDTTPPRVVAQAPAAAATAVDPAAPLTATFSEAVRPETLLFSLVGPGGAAVPAVLRYDAASRTATLDPSTMLALNTVYTATLDGALDRAGNRLTAPLVWSFTTAAAPSSSGFVNLIVTGAPPAPVLTSTFNSIGIELFYTGDDDRDATAALRFKRSADPDIPASWRQGLPLWPTTYLGGPGRAFYGSALFLDPGTAYDVEVTLADPDGTTGPTVLRGSATTRADALPPAGGLAPTHYVRAGGSDQANGLSAATAWASLGKAVAAAPPGAVVQVGPGYFAVGAGLVRTAPLTLVAEHPAVDDARNPINAGQRSVVDSGVVSGPASASEVGVARAPWQSVLVTGPGGGGAPAGAVYSVFKWPGLSAAPGWLGYASSRAAAPRRLAGWALKAGPADTPASWTERLRTNRTYNYGWAAFPNGAGGWDVYARLPGDADPNTLYLTAGGVAGLSVAGPDVRISGFELRPFSSGVQLTADATGAVVDHNLIVVGFAGVRLDADKDTLPNRYGSGHLIERNLILDTALWSLDQPADRTIPWCFVKCDVINADGTTYAARVGEGNETTGVLSRGGGRRVVVRANTIDGPFNGVGAYNEGFDRYASQDQDVHDNLIRHVADDALEPEQVAINWRVWRNRVEQASVFLSTGPVSYGPLYLVRNEAWRIGKDGAGRDHAGNPAVGATFFKYSGTSNPPARVYVLHNTLWTDSTFVGPSDPQQGGVDGSGRYAGSGSSPEQFYMRNNVVRATRYAFQAPVWDEEADSFSTSYLPPAGGVARGLATGAGSWTTDVAGYRLVSGRVRTNVGWDPATGAGSFVGASDVDRWLSNPAGGDLRLGAGSALIDGGLPVPNVSDRPGVDFVGASPDLGATEHP